jgi:hypothetical protein
MSCRALPKAGPLLGARGLPEINSSCSSILHGLYRIQNVGETRVVNLESRIRPPFSAVRAGHSSGHPACIGGGASRVLIVRIATVITGN